MWECEFHEFRKRNPLAQQVLEKERPDFCQKQKKDVTEDQILAGVSNGELFGFVECDITVPQKWATDLDSFSHLSPQGMYSEMSPIFVTSEVPFEAHMQKYASRMQLGKKPRTLLVGGMRAKQILLATPLLKLYLDRGIEVTKVYQVVEYQKSRCFAGFADAVSNSRRAPLTQTKTRKYSPIPKKGVGNQGYGGSARNKTKHTDTKYYKGHINAAQAVNQPSFRKLSCLKEEEKYYYGGIRLIQH